EEPALPRDKTAMDQLRTIGIEKGKEFKPDANMLDVLKNAAAETLEEFLAEAPKDGTQYWPQLHWRFPWPPGGQTAFKFETQDGLDVNARGLMYFLACAPPVKLGKATLYLSSFVDSSGQQLIGDNNYRLHVPANVPANQFWALTVYDSETAAFIR